MSVSRAEADLARLQNEMGRLRAQLADAEERAVKVRHYIEMARLYEAGEDAVQVTSRARGGNAAHIASMAREALQEHGEPMATRALVDVLTKRGVLLGSGNPVNYLSGVLSRADDFENDRITGWHLEAWRTALNPDPQPRQEMEHHDEQTQGRTEWPDRSLQMAAE